MRTQLTAPPPTRAGLLRGRALSTCVAFAMLATLVAAPPAQAGKAEEISRQDQSFTTAGLVKVAVEAPVGELQIVAGDSGTVRLELAARCEQPVKTDCRLAARKIKLRGRTDGDTATFDVEGWPKNHDNGLTLGLRLTLPRDLALHAELGVGEVSVSGLEGDVSLEVGVGEVNLHLPEHAVKSVALEVGVGESSLRLGGRTLAGKGFLGSDLDWRKGTGQAKVSVDCGVGEITVSLD